uniref:ABM domain-containing protein n=1 Tax=Tetradesmus obliquus TaxID=3088 RepID=A0A383VP24_TETOB|eukprot:jgi/Sobl393_1/9112/SZX67277.1
MASERLTWLAAAAGATGLLYALYSHLNKPRIAPFSLQERRDTAATRQAFVLAVNLRFQNELQKLHFLAIWQPLAEYVKAAEPVALAFEVLQADNDPCNIMVYERYVSREAYEGTHRTSPAFLHFKTAMAALPFKVELVGQSFLETNIGFML